jgi:hypothetical protein
MSLYRPTALHSVPCWESNHYFSKATETTIRDNTAVLQLHSTLNIHRNAILTFVRITLIQKKGKGKGLPVTCHEGPEGE